MPNQLKKMCDVVHIYVHYRQRERDRDMNFIKRFFPDSTGENVVKLLFTLSFKLIHDLGSLTGGKCKK